MDHDAEPVECSSPPCFLHELDPAYLGLPRPQAAEDAGLALGRDCVSDASAGPRAMPAPPQPQPRPPR
jgi:hypothetical protein